MNESKQLLWKAGIRRTAELNKGNYIEEPEQETRNPEEMASVYYNVYNTAQEMEYQAWIQPHGIISATNGGGKVKAFIKKVIRKFIEKLFGWYIFPIINQQIVYNKSCADTMNNVDIILEYQKEQIQEMARRIEELESMIKEG